MIESVCKSLNLLLTLSEFAIKFITISLQFFFFLCSFDDKVCLRMLSGCLLFTWGWFIPCNQTFIFNSQVLNSSLSILKLDSYLMSFFFSCFWLRCKDIFMDIDFLFSLFHGHFKLILSIFETVYTISLNVDCISKLLNFKLLAGMLDQGLFFTFLNNIKVFSSHFILKFKLLDLSFKSIPLCFGFIDDFGDVSGFINKLLVWVDEHIKLLLLLVKLLLMICDLVLKVLLLFKGLISLSFRDFSLHELDLIFRTI